MKTKIKATGEIKELSLAVCPSTQVVSYRDSNGVYYNTHEVEFIPDQPEVPVIDWEQRRYELARNILQAYVTHHGGILNPYTHIENSILLADELINQLKNTPMK